MENLLRVELGKLSLVLQSAPDEKTETAELHQKVGAFLDELQQSGLLDSGANGRDRLGSIQSAALVEQELRALEDGIQSAGRQAGPLVEDESIALNAEQSQLSSTRQAASASVWGNEGESSVRFSKNDVILMSSREMFVVESAGTAEVAVVRVGALQGVVEVRYTTQKEKGLMMGGSGDFEAVSGVLVFAPGEKLKQISIPIYNDSKWESIKHFHVNLTEIVTGEGEFMPNEETHGTETAVFIIDDDTYPKNLKKETTIGLFFGFLEERWRTRHPKPLKTVFCMSWKTVHGLFGIYVLKYLVDDVIPQGALDHARFQVVLWLGLAYALSALVYWKLDYMHVDIRGRSGTRKDFRNWIMQKYVWFTEDGHINFVDDTSVVNSMVNQVEDLVVNGWYGHFLFIAAAIDLTASSVVAIQLDYRSSGALAVLLPLVTLALYCRRLTLVDLLHKRVDEERNWMDQMNDMMRNWMLINAYEQRSEVCTRFKKTYDQFYKDHRKSRFYQTNSEWIPRFINEVVIAIILVTGTYYCCERESVLTVGDFVSLVSVFKRIGTGVLALNRCVVKMIRSTVALDDLCKLLNRKTNVQDLLKRTNQRRRSLLNIEEILRQNPSAAASSPPKGPTNKIGFLSHLSDGAKKSIAQASSTAVNAVSSAAQLSVNAVSTAVDQAAVVTAAAKHKMNAVMPYHSETPPSDAKAATTNALTDENEGLVANEDEEDMMARSLNTIVLRNCAFKYPRICGGVGQAKPERELGGAGGFYWGNLEIPLGGMTWIPRQGDMVAGTTTLLKLLAGLLVPTSGLLSMPAHLCVRMVSFHPMIISDSLLYNLTFGKRGISEELVWKVAKAVGLSAYLIGQGDLQLGEEGNNLSSCDRHAVCIARGLLCDPDVLLLQRPVGLFPEAQQRAVLATITQWMAKDPPVSFAHEHAQAVTHTRSAIVSGDSDVMPSFCDHVMCSTDNKLAPLTIVPIAMYTSSRTSTKQKQI
jgi:ABC-type multidrug transport system fused ATPase/permease subunit